MIIPSQWMKLWLLLAFFRGFGCGSRSLTAPDETYSSRIIEAGKDGVKLKPLSVSSLNDQQRKPIYINTTVFNEEAAESRNCASKDNEYCLKWNSASRLRIVRTSQNCENFEWRTNLLKTLTVVFDLEGLQLYGGSEVDCQSWPIQKKPFKSAYITLNSNSQAVQEPYWLDSTGQYVFVDDTVPLFVEHDGTKLQLQASNKPPYIRKTKETILKFTVCKFENVKLAHQHAISHVFKKPMQVPDYRMVQYPIWSTWATYKTNISEQAILDFARAITENGFPNSALEIDDMWETCYGSFVVDKKRFPDMKRLVQVLKKQGFRVTLWIHPFININCPTVFKEANDSKYFVKDESGSVSTKWWNGVAGIIDYTNPMATKWWANRLKSLQKEMDFDSYKFDAGESTWTPQIPVYYKMSDDYPDSIVKAYIETVRQFGDMVEVRTAKGTQDITPFVRMLDRETAWTGRLSLETLIPTLLQMSIVGYPFVLPDMIAGNAYEPNHFTEELYIRWLQANVFMPAMQFSLPPWELGSKAVNVTRRYIALHAKYAPKIYKLMQKASEDGTPVNRPMWWVDPSDVHLLDIDSQFMLGDDTLVAPVLQEGATTRDIYLPKGSWRDENHPEQDLIKGPTTLHDYKADLEVLPYFTLVQQESDE